MSQRLYDRSGSARKVCTLGAVEVKDRLGYAELNGRCQGRIAPRSSLIQLGLLRYPRELLDDEVTALESELSARTYQSVGCRRYTGVYDLGRSGWPASACRVNMRRTRHVTEREIALVLVRSAAWRSCRSIT